MKIVTKRRHRNMMFSAALIALGVVTAFCLAVGLWIGPAAWRPYLLTGAGIGGGVLVFVWAVWAQLRAADRRAERIVAAMLALSRKSGRP